MCCFRVGHVAVLLDLFSLNIFHFKMKTVIKTHLKCCVLVITILCLMVNRKKSKVMKENLARKLHRGFEFVDFYYNNFLGNQ